MYACLKCRREQERKRLAEQEKMMERQRQLEAEREEQRRKALEVCENINLSLHQQPGLKAKFWFCCAQ